ncbi:MAG TPA: TlpA disulfide reductase family protein, partial [Pirellulaceae bacterium]|nr:TlpA disulfide reductase family protein [Pirellulaceae bacterium]
MSKEVGKAAKPIAADDDKDAKPAAEAKPGEKKEASEKPAAGEKPTTTEKSEGGAWLRPAGRGVATSFVGLAALTTLTADEPKAGADAKAAPDKKTEEKKTEEKKADGKDEAKLPEGNPYLASSDLKPSELVDFIDRMQDKPKSIQSRAGFPEAIVDAADRVLAATEATDKQKLLATVAKIETLHKQAVAGVAAADEQLNKFVDTLASDMRPQVARLVKFLLLERKAIAGNDAPVEQIEALLAEIKAYCEKESLEGRHLRLASSTVQVINRIESGDDREKRFEEFGKLFGKSSDKELARYGKKLAKAPEKKESDLVGQPLQLAGAQLDGQPLNWAAYRGKVVLVDFWATWCGPCLREMPNVREYYEKNKQRGFEVVGVSIDEDLDALATFLDKNKLPWPTMAGDGSKT